MKAFYSLTVLFLLVIFLNSCATPGQNFSYAKVPSSWKKNAVDSVRRQILELPISHFTAHTFASTKRSSINYRLLEPSSVASKNYPLIVVLHGSHAVGTDNTAQMGILAKIWAQPSYRSSYPAYVIAPQFPSRSSNYVMDANQKVLVSEPQSCLNDTFELVDSLCKKFKIDKKKIYIMGHSMGASSVTNAIGLRPDLFAAGVAASGIPNFNNLLTLKSTPLWMVHGSADAENPIDTDRLFYSELIHLNGKKTKFNEIEGMGHELWPGLFMNDALPKWLFAQQRK